MSADARVWQTPALDGRWHAVHDGECRQQSHLKGYNEYDLVRLLQDVEYCMGNSSMRWGIRTLNGGLVELYGYCT